MPKVNKKELAAQVHALKPVVMIGNKGLTDAIQAEISQALDHHELIKVKIAGGDREHRDQIIQEICHHQEALLIKKIGHVFAIYRQKPDQE
jgi:RNA-binding protein